MSYYPVLRGILVTIFADGRRAHLMTCCPPSQEELEEIMDKAVEQDVKNGRDPAVPQSFKDVVKKVKVPEMKKNQGFAISGDNDHDCITYAVIPIYAHKLREDPEKKEPEPTHNSVDVFEDF